MAQQAQQAQARVRVRAAAAALQARQEQVRLRVQEMVATVEPRAVEAAGAQVDWIAQQTVAPAAQERAARFG